ncbi:MAG TPA: hypothetical protein PKD64_15300 [Pirellulaceae bacterium]|nr:hypothetical protein [Pirellulaceae bacterium]HMO93551.1 hypothetical protein [Pirellulaceae bacterium]HMP70337.1 hypothetical protein [Pirellulaceae bacterium]
MISKSLTLPSRYRLFGCAIVAVCLSAYLSVAQDDSKGKKDEKKKIPPPEVVEIRTKDEVNLTCTWYASLNGKEATPVLLLHDWGSNRKSMESYAEKLQSEGCAVLVPDLRGHGDSTIKVGLATPLNYEKFKPAEISGTLLDIEACKSFLTKRNNEAELNIDLLTVVAVGKTSILTMEWTISDWQWAPLGGIKMGQDVKGVALIAPEKSFRSLNMNQSLRHPLFIGPANESLSMLVFSDANKSERAVRDSKSIFEGTEKLRKANSDGLKYLYYFEFRLKQQVQIVERNNVDVPVSDILGEFVKTVENRFKESHRWQNRSRN